MAKPQAVMRALRALLGEKAGAGLKKAAPKSIGGVGPPSGAVREPFAKTEAAFSSSRRPEARGMTPTRMGVPDQGAKYQPPSLTEFSVDLPLSTGSTVGYRLEPKHGRTEIGWAIDGARTPQADAIVSEEAAKNASFEDRAWLYWDSIGRPPGTTPYSAFAKTAEGQALNAQMRAMQKGRMQTSAGENASFGARNAVAALRAVERQLISDLNSRPPQNYFFTAETPGLEPIYDKFVSRFSHPGYRAGKRGGEYFIEPRMGVPDQTKFSLDDPKFGGGSALDMSQEARMARARETTIFDPKDIRSPHAAFDPSKKDSPDLLAAVPVAAGAGIVATQQKKKRKGYADPISVLN